MFARREVSGPPALRFPRIIYYLIEPLVLKYISSRVCLHCVSSGHRRCIILAAMFLKKNQIQLLKTIVKKFLIKRRVERRVKRRCICSHLTYLICSKLSLIRFNSLLIIRIFLEGINHLKKRYVNC